ncbi:MAG: discoidin domain-containing protein [Pirellulales bacterium]|nr:discoidin domain-containing protein [Pirellulales bacterium]
MKIVAIFFSLGIVTCTTLLSPAPQAARGEPVNAWRKQIEADWLRQDELRNHGPMDNSTTVKPEQDAIGAVDGLIDGKWGFHTDLENEPWWQVDLGHSTRLGRIVLYNRCEAASRAARIRVLLSNDGQDFEQVYEHDDSAFYGHTDKKPLLISLSGKQARYVRLQLPGKSYFHLDEVQVFAAGDDKQNIALGKPCTQSSVSQWSVRHHQTNTKPTYPVDKVLERGMQLAENLTLLGTDVASQILTLQEIEKLSADKLPIDKKRDAYFRARWAVREMALKNPLLDFDSIVFVKRAPGMFPHMSDQYYGWWSRGGGGVYRLSGFKSQEPRLECLTKDWPKGNFLRPEISYDGKKILFAYCRYYKHVSDIRDKTAKDDLPDDAFYHVFEMNIDGTGRRQLTRGRYDDFDARYLPDGEIVFLSTRKGVALQAGKDSAAASCAATRPDSYVRCGGGYHRPVSVYTLHRMDGEGGDLRAISAFENFEWTPTVASDGRILYARWDYIDRFNTSFMSLWSTNPDGTNPQLVFGNYTTHPQCIFEARAIPNSQRLIFTASAHHSITGGALVMLDRGRGSEFDRPLTKLTPEVCYPEIEGWPEHYYANPWPLSEDYYLVAWSDRQLPAHTLFKYNDPRNPMNASGIYLYDRFGNLTLLHRDPQISSMNPIPIRPRRRPMTMPEMVAWNGSQEGRLLVQDVYQGLGEVPRGRIERLLVIGVLPKVQPQMNSPELGVSREEPGKFVLGEVPVEKDGSAFFRVPSGVPIFFQAIDTEGMAVQTMRTLTYVQPGQTMSCVGCHESRDSSPLSGSMPLAATREPSKLVPGPDGTWPLRYDQLVQPVLDRHCTRCHCANSKEANASKLDLTAGKSYRNLLNFGDKDLHNLVFERARSVVGQCPAANSKLTRLLKAKGGHYGVKLDEGEFRRLIVWMDTYGHAQGAFSPGQEEELRELQRKLAPMLEK